MFVFFHEDSYASRLVVPGTYREDISALGYTAAKGAPLIQNPYLTNILYFSRVQNLPPSTSMTRALTSQNHRNINGLCLS
jgi:hypothetical protein